jgi:hypothetical protein
MPNPVADRENNVPMKELPDATVLIASKSGRLGNRLFQNAHFMGSALAHGYRLLNPSLDEYAPLLVGARHNPLCGVPPLWEVCDPELASQLRSVSMRLCEALVTASSWLFPHRVRLLDIGESHDAQGGLFDLGDPEFLKLLHPGACVAVRGWSFSDHPNLARFRPDILNFHAPAEGIAAAARSAVNRAREVSGMVIGVHIRQEDYQFWKGGIHYYDVEDYARWMRACSEIWSDHSPAFLVCSGNEIDPRPFQGLKIFRGPGFPMGDLHALSLCDRIMGPPSTFSQWASYSGNVALCILETRVATVSPEKFRPHAGCTG